MTATVDRVWHWEMVDIDRLNASGNLAKAFKNEAPKAPGVFADAAPSDEATLLAREAIQNSWDSALEMRDRMRESGMEVPPFEVRFKFRSSLDFNVVVEDFDGSVSHPRPRSDSTLASFIDAYEAATIPQDNKRRTVRRRVLQAISGFDTPGAVGLVSGDWSYPEHRSDVAVDSHRSLVALVRNPRMVVEYLDAGRSAPFIRGCFVADDSVNDALRQTEPKGHDSWQTRASSGDFDRQYADLAKQIIHRIRNNLNTFRHELKPPPKPAEAVRLPVFDRLLRSLLSGGGGGIPSRCPTSARSPFVPAVSWKRLRQARCESQAGL